MTQSSEEESSTLSTNKGLPKENWLDHIPWNMAILAIILALLPFSPEPHLYEKFKMLLSGDLSKPLDIFDFFMHGTPITLISLKAIQHFFRS
jgi:hypothetical protein